jgi:hypothetical protein
MSATRRKTALTPAQAQRTIGSDPGPPGRNGMAGNLA